MEPVLPQPMRDRSSAGKVVSITTQGGLAGTLAVPLACLHELMTKFHSVRIVHVENDHGRPSGLRQTDENGSLPAEVTRPALPPWIKEGHNGAGERINAAQVGALAEIAAMTTPRPVAGCIGTAVLAGTDMLDVEPGERGRSIR
jgi:hypothetical protein